MKQIRRLITHGCSFTYGEELADPARSSWPALVAAKLDIELLNLAKPAYSNDAILKDIVAQDINRSSYTDLVIICWTTYLRMQYVDQSGWFTLWPGRQYHKGITWNKFTDMRQQLTKYSAILHNEDWLYERWLTHVILMQDHLEAKNAKYLFFSAFDNQQQYESRKKAHANLLGKIKGGQYIGWPSDGFTEWAYQCKLGPRGHPLEDGHEKVAGRILQSIADRYDIR